MCIGGEYRAARGKDQMARPYKRIVITHITILAGAVPVLAFGAPVALLLVLVALKLALDLYHHIKSHRPVKGWGEGKHQEEAVQAVSPIAMGWRS